MTVADDSLLDGETSLLKFGKGNAKLNKSINTFSLPAGVTCPFAGMCKSWVEVSLDEQGKEYTKLVRKTDNFTKNHFSCFAASNEALYPSLRNLVQHNWRLLKACENRESDISELLINSITKKVKEPYVRVHVSGDFYNQAYFNAWCDAASHFKDITFYAYTKSIPYWVNTLKNEPDRIPNNLVLTASYGGIHDELIEPNKLKCVKVYHSPEQAEEDGVEIDHTDELAINPDIKRFGLLIHGSQPKNSPSAEAIKELKKRNIKYSYSQKK